jgi:hypothetical protein
LYRVAFSILSDIYLLTSPTSSALVYLKETSLGTDCCNPSRHKFVIY